MAQQHGRLGQWAITKFRHTFWIQNPAQVCAQQGGLTKASQVVVNGDTPTANHVELINQQTKSGAMP